MFTHTHVYSPGRPLLLSAPSHVLPIPLSKYLSMMVTHLKEWWIAFDELVASLVSMELVVALYLFFHNVFILIYVSNLTFLPCPIHTLSMQVILQ